MLNTLFPQSCLQRLAVLLTIIRQRGKRFCNTHLPTARGHLDFETLIQSTTKEHEIITNVLFNGIPFHIMGTFITEPIFSTEQKNARPKYTTSITKNTLPHICKLFHQLITKTKVDGKINIVDFSMTDGKLDWFDNLTQSCQKHSPPHSVNCFLQSRTIETASQYFKNFKLFKHSYCCRSIKTNNEAQQLSHFTAKK